MNFIFDEPGFLAINVLHAVTLTITVDEALTNLITIEPSTLLIPVHNWNNINQNIKVTGAIGQYGDLSSFVLKIIKMYKKATQEQCS